VVGQSFRSRIVFPLPDPHEALFGQTPSGRLVELRARPPPALSGINDGLQPIHSSNRAARPTNHRPALALRQRCRANIRGRRLRAECRGDDP
jgi:hypothetical protein